MSFARTRLIVAAAAFFGWLAWLGWAVAHKDDVQPVSRAQLTAATHLVVARVEVGSDGRPLDTATVVEVISAPPGDSPTGAISVAKLPDAVVPRATTNGSRTPPVGEYLLPLVKVGPGVFRLAGLPASPGVSASNPERPRIYPWADDVKAQLRALGVLK